MLLRALYGCIILMDKAGENAGGGADAAAAEAAKLKSESEAKDKEIADYKAKIAEYEKTKNPPTLNETADKERAEKDKQKANEKALESALTFNLTAKDFLKNNESLLPRAVNDIFTTAEKENFDTPVQKASAIKAGIVQEFFKVQANHDLLTPAHKSTLDDFLKLTKPGREEKAQEVYTNIFEPALETYRRVKKAEEVGRSRSGETTGSDAEKAHKDKMIKLSKKHHMGVTE